MEQDLITRLQAAIGDAYQIEREFASGGQSRLFLANDATATRKVVIKLLPPEMGGVVEAERFKREIRVLGSLQHPNIVPLLGTGHADGLLWYVMPFIRGDSLAGRLKGGALEIPDAMRTLWEVADALAHAHEASVVHRDLKPENVLFQAEHALLADFGVAHARLEGIRRSSGVGLGEMRRSIAMSAGRLTQHGFAVGTPAYMAPEQFIGDDPADARADVYSLAMLGYEMLTGKAPFSEYKGARLMVAHFTEHAPLASHVRGEVPVGVAQVLEQGMAKEPPDRYANAAAFRDALGPRW
ncbi:MAG: serine/threonine protein kinase [Gemmatimonadetes bacterium]|nr:serine/threonine protein kinase [Gemmatimonadota bacterium]